MRCDFLVREHRCSSLLHASLVSAKKSFTGEKALDFCAESRKPIEEQPLASSGDALWMVSVWNRKLCAERRVTTRPYCDALQAGTPILIVCTKQKCSVRAFHRRAMHVGRCCQTCQNIDCPAGRTWGPAGLLSWTHSFVNMPDETSPAPEPDRTASSWYSKSRSWPASAELLLLAAKALLVFCTLSLGAAFVESFIATVVWEVGD